MEDKNFKLQVEVGNYDEHKKAGQAEIAKREALRPLTFGDGRVSKYANIFKLGDKTRHEKSFGLPNDQGGSGGTLDLHDVVPAEAINDLAESINHTAVLHAMESTDGVREVIELDPDEAEAQRKVDLLND